MSGQSPVASGQVELCSICLSSADLWTSPYLSVDRRLSTVDSPPQ